MNLKPNAPITRINKIGTRMPDFISDEEYARELSMEMGFNIRLVNSGPREAYANNVSTDQLRRY